MDIERSIRPNTTKRLNHLAGHLPGVPRVSVAGETENYASPRIEGMHIRYDFPIAPDVLLNEGKLIGTARCRRSHYSGQPSDGSWNYRWYAFDGKIYKVRAYICNSTHGKLSRFRLMNRKQIERNSKGQVKVKCPEYMNFKRA